MPIPRGAYPCADGHLWGDPDLDHAAQLMQEVARRRTYCMDNPAMDSACMSSSPEILADIVNIFHPKLLAIDIKLA